MIQRYCALPPQQLNLIDGKVAIYSCNCLGRELNRLEAGESIGSHRPARQLAGFLTVDHLRL